MVRGTALPPKEKGWAAAVLLVLLAIVHYDVIFLGRSVISTNYYNPIDYRPLPANYGPARVPYEEWTRRNLWQYANIRDPGATWWQWEPSTQFLKQAVDLGEWPFWDPYVGGGAPAMANLTPAFFFPPYTIVVLLGASPPLLNAYFLVLLWQASFLTFLFVQRHGIGFVPATMAGAMVMVSGAMHQHLGTFIGQTAACLPFMMYATRVYLDRPSQARAILATIAYTIAALASFPPLVLAMFGATTLYALVGVAEQPRGTRARVAIGWILSMVLAVGLVVFCYVPAFAARGAAPHIAIAYGGAGLETIAALHLYQLLTPTLMGGIPTYLDAPIKIPPGPYIPYVGMVALALACMAAPVNQKARTLLVSSAVATVWILLKLIGFPLVQWIGHVPVFANIHFAHYFGIPLGFLMACLAALGAQAIWAGSATPTRALVVALAAVGSVESLWHVAASHGVFDSKAAYYWIRDWRVLGVVTIGTAVAILVGALTPHRAKVRRAAVAVLVAAALAEGLYDGWYPNPAAWSIFDHPIPFVRSLQAHAPSDRIFSFAAPNGNLNEAFGIFSMDSLMTFNPPRAHRLYHYYAKPPLSIFMREPTAIPPEPVLDRANIGVIGTIHAFADIVKTARSRGYKEFFDDGFVVLFERPTLPRFFYSSEYRTVDAAKALEAIASPNSREIVLEKDPGVPASPNKDGDPLVRVEAYRRNSVTVVVDAPRPGLVYASESFFDGWTARRNGTPSEILPANYAFRAVAVPEGRSRIEFRYWPPGLTMGLWISGISLLVLLAQAIVVVRSHVRPH